MMSSAYAIIFPGQGSQSVGMLADIANRHPQIKTVFSEASDILGYDLWQLTQQGPLEKLNETEYTQPALLTASWALWQILRETLSQAPQYLAGHSLGEYCALLVANALSFPDAVRLVAARGRFMQQAVPVGQGALAAIIGLDEASIQSVCADAAQGDVLAPANYNCPGQTVIAGRAAAVDRALDLARAAGAKIAKRLAVSVPSHCALMRPAAEQLQAMLATTPIAVPTLPVINNVDVRVYQTADEIRDGLTRQLYNPVRWVATIQWLRAAGVEKLIECGPGNILAGLNRRIDATMSVQTATWYLLQKIGQGN